MNQPVARLAGGFICIVPSAEGNIGCGAINDVLHLGDVWACPKCLQRKDVLAEIDKLFAAKKT